MPYFEGSVEEAIGDTLSLVNAARSSFGLPILTELPDSRPGSASDCLYYRALDGLGVTSVGGGGEVSFDDERKAKYIASLWGVEAEGRTVHAPDQFAKVINEFDHNKVAHYNTSKPKNFK